MNQLPTTDAFGYQMPAEYTEVAKDVIHSMSLGIEAPVLFAHIYQMLSNNGKDANKVTKMDVYSFLVNCKQLKLNPLAKQIYGFVSKGKVVNIISIEGFTEIANRDPNYDGVDFELGPMSEKELTYSKNEFFGGQKSTKMITVKRKVSDWIKCIIYRKDRHHPVSVTTFFDESNTGTEPWATSPMQMLQNRAFANSVKKAFSINGYLEKEEFTDFDAPAVEVTSTAPAGSPVPPAEPVKQTTADAVEVEFEETAQPSLLAQAGISLPVEEVPAEVSAEPVPVETAPEEKPIEPPAPPQQPPLPPLPPLPAQEPVTPAPAEEPKKPARRKKATAPKEDEEVTPEMMSKLSDAARHISGKILNTQDYDSLTTLGLQIATMGLPESDNAILRKVFQRQKRFVTK